MADISTWSPVDESNTAAPPNGWPEGQATNTVNNCARAMMGATRRWYDSVVAQIAGINANFGNFLPLSGGTLSGSLSAPNYRVGGSLLATGDANYHYLYTVGDTAPILMGGPAVAHQTLYRAETHYFQSHTGAASLATLNTAGLVVAGNIGAGGAISSGSSITAAGAISSDSNITAAGNITATGGTVNAVGVTVSGTVSANYVNASQNIAANGTVQGGYVVSTGNIYAVGECRGGTLKSDGALTVTGNVTSSSITSSGNLYADGSVDGAYVQSRGSAAVAGNLTVGGATVIGGDLTSTAGYSNINAVQPGADNTGFVGRAGLSYSSMSCYNYITVSDADLKRDIEIPEDCLRRIEAIPPRTYRWADGPDQRRHWGLLAQDFGDFPGRLTDPDSGRQQLVVNELLALLWGAVRELSAKVEQMEEAAHAR